MSIGWGYGANMLTKYLGEVGERTPLTAAVCIDNPFDLKEATRSFPHHIAMDQKLTGGLIDILRTNKVDDCFIMSFTSMLFIENLFLAIRKGEMLTPSLSEHSQMNKKELDYNFFVGTVQQHFI